LENCALGTKDISFSSGDQYLSICKYGTSSGSSSGSSCSCSNNSRIGGNYCGFRSYLIEPYIAVSGGLDIVKPRRDSLPKGKNSRVVEPCTHTSSAVIHFLIPISNLLFIYFILFCFCFGWVNGSVERLRIW
jgi:hypothetical protein